MNDLHERFAPLREHTPTDEEIAAVLAAKRRPHRPRRRRRLVPALALATAAAAAAIAALPGGNERRPAPLSAAGMLRAAAAVAADQPGPPAFSGYRYTDVLEHWRWEGPKGPDEVEQRVENWVDRNWTGRVIAHQGKVIAGRPVDSWIEPDERAFVYGDGPLLDLDITALPTEPRALLRALDDNNRSLNWAPGLPTPMQARYDVTRSVLLLLGTANTTPSLRAGLWGVLALTPGLQAAPDARDPLGRDGEAVRFRLKRAERTREETFTVIFDSGTSELLSWSVNATGSDTPDQTLTFARAAHVRQIGDRPQ